MDTLLGPEGSAGTPGHPASMRGWWWVCGRGSSGSSLRLVLSLWGWWGLVGLLFEICIVDASIFTARLEVLSGLSGWGGRGVVSV